MKEDAIVTRSIANHMGQHHLPYTSPNITVYGDVTELTKALGNAPPTDSETTVSGRITSL